MGKIFEFNDVSQRKTPGVRTVFNLVDKESSTRVSVRFLVYEPGAVHEQFYHYHKQMEHIYVALEGSGTLRLNGVEHPLNANMVAIIPPGDKHAIIRVGAEGFTMLAVTSPLVSEDSFMVKE